MASALALLEPTVTSSAEPLALWLASVTMPPLVSSVDPSAESTTAIDDPELPLELETELLLSVLVE